ncbi:Uma2 family endonuclease [Streptomyces yaizuensis]|uniref:Uma2 family endonuclease n=1 Tax=Streptomyces yaizuensis TaxID=2989713 RepID=A0ABQ5P4P3_9ACTN|nr:Uma2 family endonuclease [Streptomyces sp. YSPA8]GLF97236.1 Uma2 family endonuclease [Streptomyces sp. YSPA8]
MSAAAVEHPWDDQPRVDLLAMADSLSQAHPGWRVEIIGGILTVAPSPDFAHGRALTKLMSPFMTAGLDGGETEVIQGIAVWLPTGSDDYAIPDLAVVDADADAHHIKANCYDPAVFRLVLEVTSSNYHTDLRQKVNAYAEAGIPVYVIVDRKHQRLHVLTDPEGADYTHHQIHAPGEHVTLPESIGAEVKLDVEALLKAGARRQS